MCAAILQCPHARTVYFRIAVPQAFIDALAPREKQICVLELLWVLLAVIVWPTQLQEAPLTVYEDNDAARGGIIKGMSKHGDINALLALLWGAFASIRSKPWVERIASRDNPADCLTKAGLDDSHLHGACDVSDSVRWDVIFDHLQKVLLERTLPSWSTAAGLLQLDILCAPGK